MEVVDLDIGTYFAISLMDLGPFEGVDLFSRIVGSNGANFLLGEWFILTDFLLTRK
jgi:hypothetical protein